MTLIEIVLIALYLELIEIHYKLHSFHEVCYPTFTCGYAAGSCRHSFPVSQN